MAQDPIDIKKDLGHSQDKVGVEIRPKGGRLFNILLRCPGGLAGPVSLLSSGW